MAWAMARLRRVASGTLKIEVEDNGIGVKEEDFKKLFLPPFYHQGLRP